MASQDQSRDIGERQLRGNLPQAFVPALMFECATRLDRPWPHQRRSQR